MDIMLFRMKKYSARLLTPLAMKIKGIPANYFTIGSLVSCLGAGLGFYFQIPLIYLPFLLLIEFFDQLDGVIARLQGPTVFGAFLDSMLDRYGDMLLFAGIMLGGYISNVLGLLVIMGSFLTSYARARIEALGIESLGGIGLFERTDRIPTLILGAFFQFWFPQAILIAMIILAVGTNFTAFQRFHYAATHLARVSAHMEAKE